MRVTDPIWLSLLLFPVTALAVVFLKDWKRIVVIAVATCLPTLLMIAVVIGSLPSTGIPIDFRKNPGLAMLMVVVPTYNLLWLIPAAFGVLIGWLVRRRRR